MGDRNRWIADFDAAAGEAPELARRVLDWLVETRVVGPEVTDCVLGGDGGGHAPGPAYASAVDHADDRLLDRWPNGLEIVTARGGYYGPLPEDARVGCPRCAGWLPLELVLPVVEEWQEGGPDSLGCPRCGSQGGLNDWRWPVPCAFTELGFRFWNWPPLARGFTDRLVRCLDPLNRRVIIGNPGNDLHI